MQRSSESIASLAAALAKAQQELENPEKSLIGSIKSEGTDATERLFRYASLSSGLEIVRKTLGQHEIATVQTTTIDQPAGIVSLTTMLAHSSGEWIASDWPVCAVADTAEPHRMGAALTYARRYALFTLVGITGEDDLDAPDLIAPRNPSSERKMPTERGDRQFNGSASAARVVQAQKRSTALSPANPALDAQASADLRDRLLADVDRLNDAEAAALWAKRMLPEKNSLKAADAHQLEDAFRTRVASMVPPADVEVPSPPARPGVPRKRRQTKARAINKAALALPEPRRIRDKDHLRFVAKQPCLVCGRIPSDPHHLRYSQPPALGRKVSDEFTVPVCRGHHREVHHCGDEAAWWSKIGIDALAQARALWLTTHPLPTCLDKADVGIGAPLSADGTKRKRKSARAADNRRPNYKTKPIEKTTAHDVV
jgi:hypothetical protein